MAHPMRIDLFPAGKPPQAVRQDSSPSQTTPTTSEDDSVRMSSVPLLLTPEQTATALSICRTKVYELLRTGQLESVQIGSSRRIPVAALDDYVERLRKSSDFRAQRGRRADRSG